MFSAHTSRVDSTNNVQNIEVHIDYLKETKKSVFDDFVRQVYNYKKQNNDKLRCL